MYSEFTANSERTFGKKICPLSGQPCGCNCSIRATCPCDALARKMKQVAAPGDERRENCDDGGGLVRPGLDPALVPFVASLSRQFSLEHCYLTGNGSVASVVFGEREDAERFVAFYQAGVKETPISGSGPVTRVDKVIRPGAKVSSPRSVHFVDIPLAAVGEVIHGLEVSYG